MTLRGSGMGFQVSGRVMRGLSGDWAAWFWGFGASFKGCFTGLIKGV